MDELVIGFTGTQWGMTELQYAEVYALVESRIELAGPQNVVGRHGDCVGSDKQFNDICKELGIGRGCRPCTILEKRAFTDAEVMSEPEPPIKRNHKIVDDSDVMIATPAEQAEIMRSGTWATIRYARKTGDLIFVVYPNGEVTPSMRRM